MAFFRGLILSQVVTHVGIFEKIVQRCSKLDEDYELYLYLGLNRPLSTRYHYNKFFLMKILYKKLHKKFYLRSICIQTCTLFVFCDMQIMILNCSKPLSIFTHFIELTELFLLSKYRYIDSLAGSVIRGGLNLCLNITTQSFDIKIPTHTKIQIQLFVVIFNFGFTARGQNQKL